MVQLDIEIDEIIYMLEYVCIRIARKTHNIRVFWHEKRMREKTRIIILVFW